MIKNSLLLYFLFFIALIPFALSDYNKTGYQNSYFDLGLTNFNQYLTNYDIYVRILQNGTENPLISDLNNDGIYEIIVRDKNNIRLYREKTLEIIDALTIGSSADYFSNMITFDIDGDGLREIIITNEWNYNISIIKYNTTMSRTLIDYRYNNSQGEALIGCKGVNNCLLVIGKSTFALNPTNIVAIPFNSTSFGSGVVLQSSATNTRAYCFPKIREMSISDYDNDNSKEYIFSYIRGAGSGDDDNIYISYVDVLNNVATLEHTITENDNGDITNNGDCISNIGKYFTMPLIYDFDGAISNGLETIMAFMVNNNEFKIYAYDKDGNFIDDFPEISEADGEILSNPILFNAFDDTQKQDFCVLGFQKILQEIDLNCGSLLTSHIPQTKEFQFDLNGYKNLSLGYKKYEILSHSINALQLETNGNNLDELLNSYGIFYLGDCDLFGYCDLKMSFDNPLDNAVMIAFDIENNGKGDLIGVTDFNLWYLDDKLSNSAVKVSFYEINPCLDSIWKINTSVSIKVKPIDIDNDLISMNVSLYYGTEHEQNQFIDNINSNTLVPFSFVANNTIGTGVLKIDAMDYGSLQHDIILLYFSVASNGVEFNDCITSIYIAQQQNATAQNNATLGIIPYSTSENPISKSVNTFASIFGMSSFIVFLLLMVVVGYATIIECHKFKMHTSLTLTVLACVEFAALIIGTILGMVNIGILITIIIIALLIGAIYLRRAYTGSAN